MSTIKENVDQMDEHVQLAEKQLGNKNLKKILNSIPIPHFFAVSTTKWYFDVTRIKAAHCATNTVDISVICN